MRAIPQPLKIVAWLFIVSGICAAIKIVFLLLAGHININLGVLSIFVGRGLLRLVIPPFSVSLKSRVMRPWPTAVLG